MLHLLLCALVASAQDTLTPPNDGKFFYSDFFVTRHLGYHSMPLQMENG